MALLPFRTATSDIVASSSCTSSFFAQYSNFIPNPSAPLHSEIDRLALQEGWHTREKRVGRIAAYSAELALQCRGKSRLESWQALCVDAGVAKTEGVPTSIKQCKKALVSIFINIYNLVDHRRNRTITLRRFKTARGFLRYTRRGRMFPREAAKQEAAMTGLLRKATPPAGGKKGPFA